MAIVTLTTDFGYRDAYVAILKATLLKLNTELTIIDISHEIEPANIAHGAFILTSAFRNFPESSVHIVAVDSLGTTTNKFIAAEIEGHFFIAADNGILSLISEWAPEKVVIVSEGSSTTFPARDVMAKVAAELADGAILEELGSDYPELKRFLGRSVKANKQEIVGHVAHIDHYGNLITNIKVKDFNFLSKDKSYTIGMGREVVTGINKSPSDVDAGDCFVIFNHLGLLEIGIKNGRAADLLGLQYDSQVWIKFGE